MQLEATRQIELFKEFIEEEYKEKLSSLVEQGEKSLVLDFKKLAAFDLELSEQLLIYPEETLKAAEIALEQFDFPEGILLRVRVHNLPESQKIKIRDIRSKHLTTLIVLEGIVRQASDVRPQVISARFECPSCGNVLSILQLDSKFKEPSRCSCGRQGKFRLLSKDLVDAQRLVVEEAAEDLQGGEQPKRLSIFLKEDMVDPNMEKRTTPGSKVRATGLVKEVPIQLKTGAQSTRFDIILESNYVESIQETFEDIKLSPEEENQIVALSKDKRLYEKLIASIGPSILGHEDIKEALLIQLFGGVRKVKNDNTVIRGDMHILLVGDPGCIAGESQVALIYKGMEQIKKLGSKHRQPIKEAVTQIRRGPKDRYYDYATVFQHYRMQPVLKVITETGKEVICTYNQPFLTKEGWKRADELKADTKIRVMPKIPNMRKSLALTGFTTFELSPNEKESSLPEKFTEELAALCGYVVGDGSIHSSGYRVSCYVNESESDLVEPLLQLWKETFNVTPRISTAEGQRIKTIDDGTGLLRQIVSTQKLYILEINQKQVATSLVLLANKRVPQQIFSSPNRVVSRFISWLFEADGCVFAKRRTAIQLKSRTPELLKEVQLLLLYFGIHSRINEDNLCIRRSRDIELFAKHIGFNSQKKKNALIHTLEVTKEKSEVQKRKRPQRWEKIRGIIPYGLRDVYDFEVPKRKQFIANGIVCHNSAKSTLLTFIAKAAPKSRYVAGRSASGAGITASVVKDEFLKGWALEAGAIVLANKGVLCLDEMDKMSDEDTSALHEAMEQQQISISKANVQATLIAQTTVLAAANPKLGRFDPYQPLATQIALPPALINRFDLIFPVRDIPNKEKDEKIAAHVLKIQQNPEEIHTEVPIALLRKYITYAKKINPKLTEGAVEEIKHFYVSLRNSSHPSEGEMKAIPISARQLEALVRLAEGSARIRLSKKVMKEDSQRAIRLLKHCLMQVGFDEETGQFDIDKLSTGIPASQRSKIVTIREIISNIEKKGIKTIPIDDILAEAMEHGVEEDKVEEVLEKLKRSGDIFEPKPGFIQRI